MHRLSAKWLRVFVRAAGGMLAVVTAVAVSGCTAGSTPSTTLGTGEAASTEQTPESSPPLSEQEALDIAIDTYERYSNAAGQVLRDGKSVSEVFLSTTSSHLGQLELPELLKQAEEGPLIVEGGIDVLKGEVTYLGESKIEANICVDASSARVYKSEHPRPSTRDHSIYAFKIELVLENNEFRMNGNEPWDDQNLCTEFL